MTEEFTDVQEAFMNAVDQISYLQPELYDEIAKRIRTDEDFYMATGHNAEEFLLEVLERRRVKGISTNLFIHGDGATQVGKSFTALIIAWTEDSAFTIERVFFDFTELDAHLHMTLPRTRYIVDDVRDRLGTGSKAEVITVTNFMETNAKSGTSLTICTVKRISLPSIHYSIEMLGFCDDFSLGILYGRKGIPIGWMHFVIPDEIRPLIEAYENPKNKYMLQIRTKGAGAGYVSTKIQHIMDQITEKGLEFHDKQRLKNYIDLEYSQWVTDVRRAAYNELSRILFKEKAPVVELIVVKEGQGFREFLLDHLPPSRIRNILRQYSKDKIARQDEVAKKLHFDSAARVSETITEFTEHRLGDLYEIWYNQGGPPAKEGEVDAWEDDIPTNLKATYSSRRKLRIPVEKMQPEITAALEKKTAVRVRAFNLFFNREVRADFNPQELNKRGVAVIDFGVS